MAKCFRVVGQGVPVRMSDNDAFQVVVRDHDGEYCPKSVWKRERASDYRLENGVVSKPEDNGLRRLVGHNITSCATLARNLQHSRR